MSFIYFAQVKVGMTSVFYDSEHHGLKLRGHTIFLLCKKYQGYFEVTYNLVHLNKHIQRFDFEKKRKIYAVNSLTVLKTWIFQDHQNAILQAKLHPPTPINLFV